MKFTRKHPRLWAGNPQPVLHQERMNGISAMRLHGLNKSKSVLADFLVSLRISLVDFLRRDGVSYKQRVFHIGEPGHIFVSFFSWQWRADISISGVQSSIVVLRDVPL